MIINIYVLEGAAEKQLGHLEAVAYVCAFSAGPYATSVVRLGPCLLVRDVGIQSSKVFVIQWICHVALQESDKSSHLTGRTLCVSKKLLDTICDVGHPPSS